MPTLRVMTFGPLAELTGARTHELDLAPDATVETAAQWLIRAADGSGAAGDTAVTNAPNQATEDDSSPSTIPTQDRTTADWLAISRLLLDGRPIAWADRHACAIDGASELAILPPVSGG